MFRSRQEMQAVLDHVAFGDWCFHLGGNHFGDAWMQVRFVDHDSLQEQRGRKWRLSPHMTMSELVQTAFLAVLTAMEHEVREKFLYNGRPIFGPHFDVDELHRLCVSGKFDARTYPEEPTQ